MCKTIIKIMLVIILLGILVPTICYFSVSLATSNKHSGLIDELENREYAVVLGTAPLNEYNRPNSYFVARIDATAELYKAGKVKRILVTGAYNGKQYNEPDAMRDSLVNKGIPSECIICDYNGSRTVYSILNTKNEFKLDNVILVSQRFHNQRALVMCKLYGLNAIGYDAKDAPFGKFHIKNIFREPLSRVVMYVESPIQVNSATRV